MNSFTWEKVACKKSLVEEKCVVTQKSAVVVGLQPYTNYTFRVFATSQFGRSNASEGNIWVTTNESGKRRNIGYTSYDNIEFLLITATIGCRAF